MYSYINRQNFVIWGCEQSHEIYEHAPDTSKVNM